MNCPMKGTVFTRAAIQFATCASLILCAFAPVNAGISAIAKHEVNGTTMNGVRADGTVVLGISASGLRGISASGLRGISASGLRGISASGLRGITASGLRGISASGLRGISASGLRGISASGLRGISASGLRSQTTPDNGLVFQFRDLPLAAIGTISATSTEKSTIVILGQDIVIDGHTLIIAMDEKTGLPTASKGLKGVETLQRDDYVAVAGEFMGPGRQLGTVIVKISGQFEANNSIVYLRSKFTEASINTANGVSGDTDVDYSGAMYNAELASTSSNDSVEFFGFITSQNPNRLIATIGNVVNEHFDN